MAAPTITIYTGGTPLRTDPTNFSAYFEQYLTYQVDLAPEYNALGTWVNDTSTTIDGYRVAAAASAVESSGYADDSAASALTSLSYAQDSAASSNYEGVWSSLTGAYNKGISVSNDGAFWRLNVNLADITASEPSGSNSDWSFASGNRWQALTASATLAANSQVFVTATGGSTDLTQPTFTAGDFIVVSNSKASTQTVRLLNPSNTLIFENGTVSAGDNLVITAGSTIHLYARTSTTLEAV